MPDQAQLRGGVGLLLGFVIAGIAVTSLGSVFAPARRGKTTAKEARMAGLFSLATMMLFLVIGGIIVLGALFLLLGAKLARIEPRSLGKALVVAIASVITALSFLSTIIYQGPDLEYEPHVSDPAYVGEHPRVLLDEAHFNYHTLDGSYRGFADLIEADGYRVVASANPFTPETLEGYEVLVIANARGGKTSLDGGVSRRLPKRSATPFTTG